MAKNPHFRVLALTATPGGKPEAVQTIVDALHISRIELRDEQSLDIRKYINEKVRGHVTCSWFPCNWAPLESRATYYPDERGDWEIA
jgi:hypothetical protein